MVGLTNFSLDTASPSCFRALAAAFENDRTLADVQLMRFFVFYQLLHVVSSGPDAIDLRSLSR